MASVFISHSSKDDVLASDLEGWLRSQGFEDLFIDHSAIRVGERWADALRANAGACRVVVCLVTENWLASSECPNEFRAAWYMGKRVAPLFLMEHESALPPSSAATLARVRAESQGMDLRSVRTEDGRLDFTRNEMCADLIRKGLRAAGGRTRLGLDPETFEIDRAARPSPFPGLAAFGDDDADAALFFGRSREIAESLEELRAMRPTSDRRVLMILGASGAGKSSLLKAGIIPRLRREAPAWIPLRAFRPGADPLLNFAEGITRTLADFGVFEAHGALRNKLLEGWRSETVAEVLATQAQRLRSASNRPDATVLISIDQAEELARSEGESGDALSAYLHAAMNVLGVWKLAFTIRTDSFPELQAHSRFRGLEARGYDLRTLPAFRFDNVVSLPARRYGVEIENALVDQLIEESPGKDTLPLLAFGMQRLWDQFAAQRKIGLTDYGSMRGLSGLIEDAAERALYGIEPEGRDTALPLSGAGEPQDTLGAKTFVPALADVNEEGGAIRRIAAWSEFDLEQKALLERLARWRLIVKKGTAGTVEVAHEALFREWPRLAKWLEPERLRLATARSVESAARDWLLRGRRKSDLVHRGQRLVAARMLLRVEAFSHRLGKPERAYLKVCAATEFRRRFGRAFLIAIVAFFAGGIATWLAFLA